MFLYEALEFAYMCDIYDGDQYSRNPNPAYDEKSFESLKEDYNLESKKTQESWYTEFFAENGKGCFVIGFDRVEKDQSIPYFRFYFYISND